MSLQLIEHTYAENDRKFFTLLSDKTTENKSDLNSLKGKSPIDISGEIHSGIDISLSSDYS